MTQRTSAEIGFVKFSDSDFVFENPEQDTSAAKTSTP